MLSRDKQFLLIKACGAGFWHDMEHVVGALLIAEMANRTPVIYWGENSLYGGSESVNAFEQFFLPVSEYTIDDLMQQEYTVCPEMWNISNLRTEETERYIRAWWHPIEGLLSRSENVLVLGWAPLYLTQAWLRNTHPAFGSPQNAYLYIFEKYLNLQPKIALEIDEFYRNHMSTRQNLAVHIRASDKISEVEQLHQINERYPAEIEKCLRQNPSANIFMLTDSDEILLTYLGMYKERIIHIDCQRTINDKPIHYDDKMDKVRMGIEILKDVFLATRCDFFIGNMYSNVSNAITRLKRWPPGRMKLLSLLDLEEYC